ncbi:hypothetical protein BH792_gp160 [Staphylococcus phage Stau2]|uniref:Uncharacterized protein n=7 Tax=Silviavirus TaxID=1857889 RepID=A0A0U1ZWQ5_9CAUD|nr:hypothetical protein F422_gp003 [Staphylococcus phage SA11]YP_007677638.1 hypothetical protein QLX36_gp134 [Staphylococcus phage vB_SauM_Romulus]YP_008431278.1 hypothetical protein O151_gp031 [Staphylococcus phage vB_SauM_Remus]YP_009275916.1 hypothetical protein BH792_gp160 [Staphylococcus phage Stau2]APC43055.1 hypothetical protein SAP1_190 [Staphylococcus phage StAP1]ARQ95792.1 hypothetical protein qdsa001_35 [Staphylococcus phage qdsa001]QVD57702.1 hypothetical protein PM56_157 [Staphy
MERYSKEYVDIDITVRALVQTPYRDSYDVTNNRNELVEDNIVVNSLSDYVKVQEVKINDID